MRISKNLVVSLKALADMSADDVDVAAFRPIASIDTKVNKDTLGKSDRVVDLTKVFVERLTTAAYSNLAQELANEFNANSMGSKFGFPVAAQ